MDPASVFRVTSEDFDEVAEPLAAVYVKCFASAPWYEVFQPENVIARMREVLTFDDSVLVVAESGDRVLGGTLLYPLHYNKAMSAVSSAECSGAMYCEELFVSGEHHRRGVGGRLFDTATGICLALGYDVVALRTGVAHEEAKRFYASRGYTPIALMECHSRRCVHGAVQDTTDVRVVMRHACRRTASIPCASAPQLELKEFDTP